MAKLKDIAERAGVSASAVSYVLNGRGEEKRIARSTQEQIRKIAQEMNYHPNVLAKRLKREADFVPMFVVMWNMRVNSDLLERFMKGAERLRSRSNFELIIYPYHSSNLAEACEYLKKAICNGAFWLGSDSDHIRYAEQYDYSIPITVLQASERFHTVELDDLTVGQMAAEHMFRSGCRKIVIIDKVQGLDRDPGRIQMFEQQAKKLGFEAHRAEKEYEYSMEGGMLAAKEALERFPDADGLYFIVDILAAGGVNWLTYHGMEVGKRIKVMSHGNAVFSRCTYPQITVSNLPVEEMAEQGIDILLKNGMEKQSAPVHIVLPTNLIIRQSCELADSAERSG